MKCTADEETPLGVTGDHDWVLVKKVDDYFHQSGKRTLQLPWACPCGEFKWTSYAEWEHRQGSQDIAPPAKPWELDASLPTP